MIDPTGIVLSEASIFEEEMVSEIATIIGFHFSIICGAVSVCGAVKLMRVVRLYNRLCVMKLTS